MNSTIISNIRYSRILLFFISLFLLSCRSSNSSENNTIHPVQKLNHLLDYKIDSISFRNIKIDSTAILSWVFNSTDSIGNFKIEEYRWNKWDSITSIKSNNEVQFQVQLDNDCEMYLLRISHIGKSKKHSKLIDFKTPNEMYLECGYHSKYIHFSNKTKFEIYDKRGMLIAKGCDSLFDKTTLPESDTKYYCSFGNKIVTVFY